MEQFARCEAKQAESCNFVQKEVCGEIVRRSGISGAKINLYCHVPESTETAVHLNFSLHKVRLRLSAELTGNFDFTLSYAETISNLLHLRASYVKLLFETKTPQLIPLQY